MVQKNSVILTGWYRPMGAEKSVMLDETGSSLNEIVDRLQRMDIDFGHTDMELELHLPDGTIKFVEDTVSRIVSDK
tara:strand:+ start:742 stop:969 length:228 start_codon:yes stop_codon:yes gene_type:complete